MAPQRLLQPGALGILHERRESRFEIDRLLPARNGLAVAGPRVFAGARPEQARELGGRGRRAAALDREARRQLLEMADVSRPRELEARQVVGGLAGELDPPAF